MLRIEYNPLTELCNVNLCGNMTYRKYKSADATTEVELYKGATGICFWSPTKIYLNCGSCYISPQYFKKAIDIMKKVDTLGEIEVNYEPKRLQLYKKGKGNVRSL